MLSTLCNPMFKSFVEKKTSKSLGQMFKDDELRCLCSNPSPKAIQYLNTIDSKYLDWEMLSANPAAITMLEQNQHKIVWYWLSQNPDARAIHLLKMHPERINWSMLSANPGAFEILSSNQDKINWNMLSSNESLECSELCKANLDKVTEMCYMGPNPFMADIILENLTRVPRNEFKSNPDIRLVNKHAGVEGEDVAYKLSNAWGISSNVNDIALTHLFANYPNNVEYTPLSKNPNPLALDHLLRNTSKINWEKLLTNPGLF